MRVDRVLRRSLGVSETAKTDATVKPAPPIDPELPADDEGSSEFDYLDNPTFRVGDEWKEWKDLKAELKEGRTGIRDEL